MLMRIKPRNEGRQARPAEARRDIPPPKNGTPRRQPIEVRRADRRVFHESEIGPRLVVGNDQHDIRRASRIRRPSGGGRERHRGNFPVKTRQKKAAKTTRIDMNLPISDAR